MQNTNTHLKGIIGQANNFLVNDTPLPEDLAFKLVGELKVSSLIIPAKIYEDCISFPEVIGDDGTRLIPLFTDIDEFSKKFSDEFYPLENELDYYIDIINHLGFDGMIVNSESDKFFVDGLLLNQISTPARDNTGKYDALKLKEIAENVSNESLSEAIRNGVAEEDIAEFLGESILLNVISSSAVCYDGILNRNSTDDFNLATVKEGRNIYGALFTGIDEILRTSYNQDNYYFQITNIYEVFSYILMRDMDGVIINPGIDDFFIERHVLIEIYEDEMLENRDLANSIDYAFKI